ncbi:MAG TPA: class I adenylate-forming enzyme family protein [Acidimicrobiia bacterium]|nr:class I adenylate-forming enzyme family protein [Acidimicrobiia bacterium]
MTDLLVDQLRLMAERHADDVGYRDLDGGAGLTFGEWEERSNRFARGLVEAGVAKGDRVGLFLPNTESLPFVTAYAAIHKAGAVAVPTNNRLSAGELETIWRHAEVSVAVTASDLLPVLREARAGVPSITTVLTTDGPAQDAQEFESLFSDDGSAIQVDVDSDDLADIMYTSGTTGLPKGVAVRHCNLAMIPPTDPEWSGGGWIHSSPLFTFAGIGFIYNPMKLGMVSLYQAKFDAGRWIEFVETLRPRFAFIVPAMGQLIAAHPRFDEADLSSIELCSIGSAPLPFEVLKALQEKMPEASVSNSYGMTEAGAAYCVMPKGESLHRKGSVGIPLPPAELKIVDDNGNEVAVGAEGEVLIRNPGRPREYYRDPEATAAVWEPDGWLHTGDIGRFDPDGYLYVVGRIKDVIIRGGNNIHASDIEAVLYEHPDVFEASVCGVPHEVLGEDVAAFVVAKEGSGLTEEALAAFCEERLADYKRPRQYHFVKELPRNATGKVLKRELIATVS